MHDPVSASSSIGPMDSKAQRVHISLQSLTAALTLSFCCHIRTAHSDPERAISSICGAVFVRFRGGR